MRFPFSVAAVFAVVISVGSLAGCAPNVRAMSADVAKGATPAAAESGLATMEDPETRARLAKVLGTPEMQLAMREVSAGLSRGVVEGLSSEAMEQHLDKLVTRLSRATILAISKGMDEDLSPAMERMVGSSIDAAMSSERRAQMSRLAGAIVAEIMRSIAAELPASVAPAMRKALHDDLGPALRETVNKDLTPALADMARSPAIKAAFGEAAHEVARQSVLGSNQALAELAEQRKRENGGGPLGSVVTFFGERTWLLGVLMTVLMFSVPLVWLVVDRRRRQRAFEARRAEGAAAILDAMDAKGDSRELVALLRRQLLVHDEPKKKRHRRGPPTLASQGT